MTTWRKYVDHAGHESESCYIRDAPADVLAKLAEAERAGETATEHNGYVYTKKLVKPKDPNKSEFWVVERRVQDHETAPVVKQPARERLVNFQNFTSISDMNRYLAENPRAVYVRRDAVPLGTVVEFWYLVAEKEGA